jgi:hypothetical protein
MKRRPALFALWLMVTALLSLAAPPCAAATADPSRRILVMLKMPPEHYRPGSTYAGGYGASAMQDARHRIAAAIARRHGFTLENSWPMPLLGVDCYVMTLPDGITPDAAAEQVSHEADVAWSEPLQLYEAKGAARR